MKRLVCFAAALALWMLLFWSVEPLVIGAGVFFSLLLAKPLRAIVLATLATVVVSGSLVLIECVAYGIWMNEPMVRDRSAQMP